MVSLEQSGGSDPIVILVSRMELRCRRPFPAAGDSLVGDLLGRARWLGFHFREIGAGTGQTVMTSILSMVGLIR